MRIESCLPLLTLLLAACGGDYSGNVAPPPPPPVTTPQPSGDYTAFANETPVVISGHGEDAMEPFIAKDGQTLFFNNSNAPSVNTDLFYATRVNDGSFANQGRIAGANSTALDAVASMDRNGIFYFISTRDYDASLSTIYSGSFANGSLTAPALVSGISRLERGILNFDGEISGDGQTLWFDDGKFSGGQVPDTAAIVVADRQGNGFARRADSAMILANVNAAGLNYAPCISADGLELFFTRITDITKPAPVIMRSSRANTAAAFATPQKVSAITGYVEAPSLSADGRTLYYHKQVGTKFGIYLVTR